MTMMEESVRFGVMGCEKEICAKILAAMASEPSFCSIHACAMSEKAKTVAPANARVLESYDAIVEEECLDAVYVCLANPQQCCDWAVKAASSGKHVLVDAPPALCASDFDRLANVCRANAVQFMDSTAWLHHPRTLQLGSTLRSQSDFGILKAMHICYSAPVNESKVEGENALGELGWDCIRAMLWAKNYEMPRCVTALQGAIIGEGVSILACGSSFLWKAGAIATFYSSHMIDTAMDWSLYGTTGSVRLLDFVVPYDRHRASYDLASGVKSVEPLDGWKSAHVNIDVDSEFPQEVLMLRKMASLVKNIRDNNGAPQHDWLDHVRKTLALMDAIKQSLSDNFSSVLIR